MCSATQRINSVVHPSIKEIYLKKDLFHGGKDHNTLVIKIDKKSQKNNINFLDFLEDLDGIRKRANAEAGQFSHVDIVMH